MPVIENNVFVTLNPPSYKNITCPLNNAQLNIEISDVHPRILNQHGNCREAQPQLQVDPSLNTTHWYKIYLDYLLIEIIHAHMTNTFCTWKYTLDYTTHATLHFSRFTQDLYIHTPRGTYKLVFTHCTQH